MREIEFKSFLRFLETKDINKIEDVNEAVIDAYQDHLYYCPGRNGNGMSKWTQISYLSSLKGFFRSLIRMNILLHNPADNVDLPKKEQRLPKGILTKKEVKKLLRTPDLKRKTGFRDRTILEILYSCGLRSSELASLKVHNVNFKEGMIAVEQGKGLKDRVIPIGVTALEFIAEYIEKVRPLFDSCKSKDLLMLTNTGQHFTKVTLNKKIKLISKQAGLERTVNPRHFRYTLATDLLKSGVDLRYVQEILGHEQLKTTTLYAQVFQKDLKRIHRKTHPREKLQSKDIEFIEINDYD